MKKALLIILGAVLLLLVAGGLVVKQVLSNLASPDFFVSQIESQINARAEISSIAISPWQLPAKISLVGFKLTPRDSYANQATPLSERPPLTEASLEIPTIDLQVDLSAALSKRIAIDEFILDQLRAQITVRPDGSTNISEFLAPPTTVAGKPAPPPLSSESSQPSAKPGQSFDIRNLPFSAAIDTAGIRNAEIDLFLESSGAHLLFSDLLFLLTAIDLVPRDLANHNSADLRLDSHITLTQPPQEEPQGEFQITSRGKIVPFDSKTGAVNPQAHYQITIARGAYLQNIPFLQKLSGTLNTLSRIGLELEPLADRVELQEDALITIVLNKGRITFVENASFAFANFQLDLQKDSWLSLAGDKHHIVGQVVASPALSAQAIEGVDQSLEKNIKGANTEALRDALLVNILQEDRIHLDFTSSGKIADPKVELHSVIPKPRDVIAKQGIGGILQIFEKPSQKEEDREKPEGESNTTEPEKEKKPEEKLLEELLDSINRSN